MPTPQETRQKKKKERKKGNPAEVMRMRIGVPPGSASLASRDPEPILCTTLLGQVSVIEKVELDGGRARHGEPSPAADAFLVKQGLAQEVSNRNVFQ